MPTIFVHGYNYNLAHGDNPGEQFSYWRNFAKDGQPFTWQSIPAGGVLEAWTNGSWNRYYWAWKKAIEVASRLVSLADETGEKVDVVCHSLGSRVVYEAVKTRPELFRRVLTLNGADSAAHARACLQDSRGPTVLCVMTEEDNVLRYLGRTFTPVCGKEHVVGYDGLKKPWPPNWFEYNIGKAGEGPGWKDHDYSFKNRQLWPLWGAFLQEGVIP